MTLPEYHALLTKLDFSAKGRRRKSYREAKLLAVLSPSHASLWNAFEAGEKPPTPEAHVSEPEPLPTLPHWQGESTEGHSEVQRIARDATASEIADFNRCMEGMRTRDRLRAQSIYGAAGSADDILVTEGEEPLDEQLAAPAHADAVSAAEAFDATAYDDRVAIPRFVPPKAAKPRSMDPFPSLIYGTGLDQIVPSAPRHRLWRTWLHWGGWLLSTAMASSILSYHLALPPAPQQVTSLAKTNPAQAEGAEITTASLPPAKRITVITKTYTDRVPQ